MSWDALRDRESGRPRHHDRRPSQPPAASTRPKERSLSPASRSQRALSKRPAPTEAVPAAIEEELWFGGQQDAALAEDAAAKSMAALVGRIVGAKPFPESARKLAELTRKDVVRIEPIISVLERDPALSARLLRLVNSAGYALRQRCTSVRHAATLVGTDRLHQIATTAAVLELFDSRGSIATKIVEHCTIVGAFCRYFGAHLALPVDDLFTAGFLHDIGKLMLLETEGDQYFELLEKFADRPDSIHVVERSLYGFDHAVLAAHVLSEWNIPDPVPKIVAWHHDPTRAYRVSSMMAAMVQTVRLADLAVYAMIAEVDQEHFSTLASTESANYLDISEPQLSSMWDELQTLYRESIEQCRGDNAPALDPRSLRPKMPISINTTAEAPRTTELPLQFPCVVCGRPSFGNTCRACGGHMCPEHQEGREDWCTICARDFHQATVESHWAMSPTLASLIGLATVIISVAIGYETEGSRGGVRAGVGTVLLLLLATLLTIAGRRLATRFRFVRTRPNRAIAMPQESDGGSQSLIPAMDDVRLTPKGHGHNSLSEQLRLSSAALEHIMIREAPSVPSIIAPKPFEGLTEAVPPSSRNLDAPSREAQDQSRFPAPGRAEPAHTSAREDRLGFAVADGVDAERLAQQGRSLVTLPAPTFTESEGGSPPLFVPLTPSVSIDIDSDERASELGLNGLGATPSSEPPEDSQGHSTPNFVVGSPSEGQKRPASGTYPSSRPPALESLPLPVTPSQHPLAALGIQARPPSVAPIPPSEAETDAVKHSSSHPPDTPITEVVEGRQTLLGLSAAEIQDALNAPEDETIPGFGAKRERPSEMPPAEAEGEVEAPPSDATTPGSPTTDDSPTTQPEQVQALASEHPLPSSRPPSALGGEATGNEAVSWGDSIPSAAPVPDLAAAARSVEQQVLSHMGPEFEAKVMDLVAEKIAAMMAKRMMASLGETAPKSHPGRAVKTAKARKATATAGTTTAKARATRRKAQQS